jgi:ParB family chromosome partitioning protein
MAIKRGGLGTNLDSLIPTSLTVAGTERSAYQPNFT